MKWMWTERDLSLGGKHTMMCRRIVHLNLYHFNTNITAIRLIKIQRSSGVLASRMASVTATQLCHCSTKAARDKMNERG